ncbi:MAG: PilX N-terminal domain-containing pilus assembly protein [Methylococcaceae bacterium]
MDRIDPAGTGTNATISPNRHRFSFRQVETPGEACLLLHAVTAKLPLIRPPDSQRGVILVVSLLLLTLLSVMAVTATHIDTTQLRIIANMQDELSLDALTQAELDQVLSQARGFQLQTCDPPPYRKTFDAVRAATASEFEFDLDEPRCLHAQAESGSSALSGVGLEETLWELRIKGRDLRTGNELIMRSGVVLHQPAGMCPLQLRNLPCE